MHSCSDSLLRMLRVSSMCLSLIPALVFCALDHKASQLWLQPLNKTFLQTGTFPSDFLWGVGTSAFQTEGSWDVDGKGESVWDRFTHHSSTGDSYLRWEEDLKSVQYLGVNFYSFSLSWTRLFPNGDATENPNPAGVEHYRRLIGRLKELQIEPVVTLFHWDFPQVLQERLGGWLNESMEDVFADYASFCFRTFGGQIRYWITMHNPFLLAVQGYGTGAHAPGVTGGPADPFIAAHNLIRAHAKAWHVYDQHFRPHQNGKVSITLGSHWVQPHPGSASPRNQELCRKSMEAVIGWFAEPIFGSGDYPESLKASNRGVIPEFTVQQKLSVKGTADFFSLAIGPETHSVSKALVGFGQSVFPDLRSVLAWVRLAYGDPRVLVAESGWFSYASVGVEDTNAFQMMKLFIIQVMQAVSVDGVSVFGYTAWSLLDGYEWSHRYSRRRGLFYIDFSKPERRRIPKTSALFYRRVIRDHGFPDDDTRHIEGRFPCDFQFGVSARILQVHLHPSSPQFTDPHLYRWNYSGDDTLKPVTGIELQNRAAQCKDFLYIQRHLYLLEVTGSSHYRFALDWTQIMPSADPSSVDAEKVRFYRCVLSELTRRGIQPVVTLYHLNYRSHSLGMPEPLHANGGWRNRSAVEAFVSYATFCFQEFGGFVQTWITINELNRLAEAYNGTADDRRMVARHLLLAHAKAWRVYDTRFRCQQGAAVSFALHANWVEPANPFVESHEAARQGFLSFFLSRFLDPVFEGRGNTLIGFTDDEREELKGTLDFVALNHFSTHLVSPWDNPSPKPANQDHDYSLRNDNSWPESPWGHALVPWGLRRVLGWVTDRYGDGLPIIITAAGVDDQAPRNDQLRQRYIRDYLQEALKARELDGVNLRGFYIWELQDHHHGYKFGLFTSTTQRSRPKASVDIYRDIITRRGFPSAADRRPFTCQVTVNQMTCDLCTLIAENKPLLFFSVCVSVSVSMLSALIIVSVLRKRRMRKRRTITMEVPHDEGRSQSRTLTPLSRRKETIKHCDLVQNLPAHT